MKKPIIVGITGMPASGKSTCADAVINKEGVVRIRLSDFIWSWLAEQGIKKTSVTGAMYGLYLHTIYDSAPIIKWVLKQIKQHKKAKVIVLDTIRTLGVYHIFKKKYNHRFKLVAVVASPELRKKREIQRGRFGQSITEKGFIMRDTEELEIGVGSVMALAEEYIDASQSKAKMLAQMEKVFSKVAA